MTTLSLPLLLLLLRALCSLPPPLVCGGFLFSLLSWGQIGLFCRVFFFRGFAGLLYLEEAFFRALFFGVLGKYLLEAEGNLPACRFSLRSCKRRRQKQRKNRFCYIKKKSFLPGEENIKGNNTYKKYKKNNELRLPACVREFRARRWCLSECFFRYFVEG